MTNASSFNDDRSELTGEQYEMLEVAYEAGYFEHPRRTPGAEVAESLDISPATFQRHLQVALATCVEERLMELDRADD